jgi:PAS domain S-box-containing protein
MRRSPPDNMPFEALLRRIRGSNAAVWELFDAMNAGVWIVDPALDTQYVNTHLAALLGHGSDEMLGRCLLSFVPAEAHDIVRAHFQSLRLGDPLVELRLRHKDGSLLTVTVAASVLPADGDSRAWDASSPTSPRASRLRTCSGEARRITGPSRAPLRTTSSSSMMRIASRT